MDDLFSRVVWATLSGTVAFLAIIFLPAGTVDYWQGWAFSGTLTVSSLLVTVYMALNDRQLPRVAAAHGAYGRKDGGAEGHHGCRLRGLRRGARLHGP